MMLPVDQLTDTYTTEQVLMILLTRLYFGTQTENDVQKFINEQGINWDAFYKLASVNQVRGFLYDIISSSRIKTDPKLISLLGKDATTITRLGFYQLKLTQNLLNDFKNKGITVIPYKGAVLAGRYYKTPFLRESNDIDFLADKDDVPALRAYFHKNGYETKFDAADKYLPFILRYYRDLAFTAPMHEAGLKCSVEIQWQLLDAYFGQFSGFDFFAPHLTEDNSRKDIPGSGLTPACDFLCAASHHLIKEPLWKFKYLVDLACIVQSSGSEFDWGKVINTFRACNYPDFLFSGMNALHEVLGISIPQESFSPVSYRLFMAGKHNNARRDHLQMLSVIYSKQTFVQKVKFSSKVFLSLFTPNLKDLSLIDLPAWAVPLLMPVKPFRLLYGYLFNKDKA